MSKEFLFVGNSPYTNHGSEAIVRGTVRILREAFDDPKFITIETETYPHSEGLNETDPGIEHAPLYYPRPKSLQWFLFQASKAILGKPAAYQLFVRQFRLRMNSSDAILFLGGDNFADQPFYHIAAARQAIKMGKPTALWGCSVGPFSGPEKYQQSVFDLLKKFTAIFIREDTSLAYLADNGVSENVHRIEDPAFVMEPERPTDTDFLAKLQDHSIGLSLSSLILNRSPYKGRCEQGVVDIVDALRDRFGKPIVLVPHCVGPKSDFDLLNGVLQENAARWPDVVCIPKNMPAAQIKWVVGTFDFHVGARMHSTIASFGMCIPTVSLAYSFKAEGLNKRLFGHLKYMVRNCDISPDSVIACLERVMADSDNIRLRLTKMIPEVQDSALRAGVVLRKLMQ